MFEIQAANNVAENLDFNLGFKIVFLPTQFSKL